MSTASLTETELAGVVVDKLFKLLKSVGSYEEDHPATREAAASKLMLPPGSTNE